MKTLVLLTNYFPYYKGEEYLETEIKYLSREFKKIVLIPTMISPEMKLTREVPENVQLVVPKVNLSSLNKVMLSLKYFIPIVSDAEKRQNISNDSEGKLRNKLFSYYFEARAIYTFKNILEKLKEEDINISGDVVIYSYWLFITANLAIKFKKYLQQKDSSINVFKVVSRAHGYDINEHANSLNYLPCRNYFINHLDNIYPVSECGTQFLKDKYSKNNNSIQTKYLGITPQKGFIRHESNEFHIVTCSAIRKLKRLDILIDALKIVSEAYCVRWTHLGSGTDEEEIKDYALKQLKSEIYHFQGYVKNKEIIPWYIENNVTILVNTSESEGLPVSIIEAMSVGIPVIATNVGGTKEIVNSENGYLLSKDVTPKQLAEKIIEFIKLDKDSYKNMSNNAHMTWETKFNSENVYKEFIDTCLNVSEVD